MLLCAQRSQHLHYFIGNEYRYGHYCYRRSVVFVEELIGMWMLGVQKSVTSSW